MYDNFSDPLETVHENKKKQTSLTSDRSVVSSAERGQCQG